jgi:hypothetical protein
MNKLKLILGVGAASCGALLAGGVASASGVTVAWYDTNGDGIRDYYLIDQWGDGIADIIARDSDQNSWIEVADVDVNNDGYYEATAFDTSGNGVFDHYSFDTDLDGYWDVHVEDVNEDGEPDWLPNGQSSEITAQMQIEALNTSILMDMMVEGM